ncbi:hypothetical protein ACOME3_000559 [Neoechinorhynchus agilis]
MGSHQSRTAKYHVKLIADKVSDANKNTFKSKSRLSDHQHDGINHAKSKRSNKVTPIKYIRINSNRRRSLCRADRFSVSNRQRRIDMKKRSGATVVYMGDERLV